MNLARVVCLGALLLAGCVPAAPGAAPSVAPSADADPPVKAEDFKPTRVALTVDGKAEPVALRGFLVVGSDNLLAGSLGVYKGGKAATATIFAPSFTITGAGKKAISAPDFSVADAVSVLIGLNWTKDTTARTFTPVGEATVTVTPVDGKLKLAYAGRMNRGPGNGEFPESIQVTLEAEGIPTKKP